MIFILAYAHTRTPQYHAHIEKLVELSRGMEQIGFTKMVTEETPMRLAELGITGQVQHSNGNSNEDSGPVHLDDEMIAQLWGNWDP
jgi:aldehyde dehydrogenase (NAD+)